MKRLLPKRLTGMNLASVYVAWESGDRPRRVRALAMPEVFGVTVMAVRSTTRAQRSPEIHERTMEAATTLVRLNRDINQYDQDQRKRVET